MKRQSARMKLQCGLLALAFWPGAAAKAQSTPSAEYIYLGERLVAIERPVVAGAIAVSVTPNPTSVVSGNSVTFAASVTNAANTSVTWSVVTASGGTITAAGVYTSPAGRASNLVVTVRATSVQDVTKYGEAQVTVTPAAAGSCSISPAADTYASGGQSKAVTVTCTAGMAWTANNGGSSWVSVSPASGTGSGSVTVTAASNGVGGAARSAGITVAGSTYTVNQQGASELEIRPGSAQVLHDQEKQFDAYLNGAFNNSAVQWRVSGVGTITPLGKYKAPSVILPSELTATIIAEYAAGSAVATATAQLVEFAPPSGFSVSPSSGTAANQVFRVTVNDVHGANAVQDVFVLFSTSSSELANACYIKVNTDIDMQYVGPPSWNGAVVNQNGGGWSSPISLGTTGAVESSRCRLQAAGSQIVRSGNTVIIDLNLEFKPGFTSFVSAYVKSKNKQNAESGFVGVGGWDLRGIAPALVPTVTLEAPAAGATVGGLVEVKGWALDNSTRRENKVTNVELYIDGVYQGYSFGRQARTDVCTGGLADRMDCPNPGFSIIWDTRQATNGTHTLTVKAIDSDFIPKPFETPARTVTVYNPPAAPVPVINPSLAWVRLRYNPLTPETFEQQQFTATVGGSPVTDITWGMNKTPTTNESLSATGLYLAPSDAMRLVGEPVEITALRQSTGQTATNARITIVGIMSCGGTPNLTMNSQFHGSVSCVAAESLTGFVLTPAVGSMDAYNYYTPPATNSTQRTVIVEARSVSDANKKYKMKITLMPY